MPAGPPASELQMADAESLHKVGCGCRAVFVTFLVELCNQGLQGACVRDGSCSRRIQVSPCVGDVPSCAVQSRLHACGAACK
jgi:hypothetical protein